MKIGKIIIYPWNRKNFIPRVVALGLIFGWLFWTFTIYQEGKRLEANKRAQQEKHRVQLERQRRQAAYERRLLEEKSARSGVQNAMDGIKR